MVRVFKDERYYFETYLHCFDFSKNALRLMRKEISHFKMVINNDTMISVTSYIRDGNRISNVVGGYLVRFSSIRPYQLLDKYFMDYSVFNYFYYKSAFQLRKATLNHISDRLRCRLENGNLFVFGKDGIKELVDKETLFDIYHALLKYRYYKNNGWLITNKLFLKDHFSVDETDFIVFGDALLYCINI
ncbi:MAG: hypothetical protein QXX30_00875 [Candidatus Aenigmatarchaeota archaeon]